MDLIEWDGWINGAGPLVDAAGEGLDVVEALAAQPHGDRKRAGTVMAEDDGRLVGVEFSVGTGCNLAHGNANGPGDACRLDLPGIANVE